MNRIKRWLATWSPSQEITLWIIVLAMMVLIAYCVTRYEKAEADAWYWHQKASEQKPK